MAKLKTQKTEDLQELSDKVKSAKGMVFAGYSGTTVKDMDKFRKALRLENIFAKVYKITLIRKALASANINADGVDYKQPVIIAISEDDEVSPARVLKTVNKELKTIIPLQGVLDGKLVTKEMVMALADLPSKDQLRAQVVGTINAPVSGFVNVLAGNLRGLINVLNAVAQKA